MWLFWTILNLAWVVGFAIGETYAFMKDNLTLSAYVYDLSVSWGPFQYLLGFVQGGLAVHFFWHWLPSGAKSVG